MKHRKTREAVVVVMVVVFALAATSCPRWGKGYLRVTSSNNQAKRQAAVAELEEAGFDVVVAGNHVCVPAGDVMSAAFVLFGDRNTFLDTGWGLSGSSCGALLKWLEEEGVAHALVDGSVFIDVAKRRDVEGFLGGVDEQIQVSLVRESDPVVLEELRDRLVRVGVAATVANGVLLVPLDDRFRALRTLGTYGRTWASAYRGWLELESHELAQQAAKAITDSGFHSFAYGSVVYTANWWAQGTSRERFEENLKGIVSSELGVVPKSADTFRKLSPTASSSP